MEFNSQICTTEEQSKRLLALGLKKETADCRICPLVTDPNQFLIMDMGIQPLDEDEIPAWSLHRLMEMVPFSLMLPHYHQVVYTKKCIFFERDGDIYCSFNSFDSIYDNLIDCIEWLIKEGHFNKDYLDNK